MAYLNDSVYDNGLVKLTSQVSQLDICHTERGRQFNQHRRWSQGYCGGDHGGNRNRYD